LLIKKSILTQCVICKKGKVESLPILSNES
jgi:hypothetical protein